MYFCSSVENIFVRVVASDNLVLKYCFTVSILSQSKHVYLTSARHVKWISYIRSGSISPYFRSIQSSGSQDFRYFNALLFVKSLNWNYLACFFMFIIVLLWFWSIMYVIKFSFNFIFIKRIFYEDRLDPSFPSFFM